MKNQNSLTIFAVLLIMLGMIVLAWLGFEDFLKLQEKKIKNTAIDECLKLSRYNTEQQGESYTTISEEPTEKWYKFCMEEKGY